MCGITGILAPNHHERIEPMTRVLTHRGPDEEGYYHDDILSLGQRRLSIVDLAGGRQPIANEDESIQLVCNGEIYNSPALREELLAKGHTFRTSTDVEVILHLYEEYGEQCVTHLRGMFGFAIWDRKHRRLMLGRDHLGQKPVYYHHRDGKFLFASEVKALLASEHVKPEIEVEALWHYVSLRYIPDHYSLFKGIHKLPAASYLVLEEDRVRIEKYWDLGFTPKHTGSEEEITDGLEETLLETIKLHLLSDVPIGTFLSGGIDSSLITAMMAKLTGERFPTFSIGVKEQNFNELPYARMVSEQYGLDAHERIVQADMIHLIPSMIYHMDEPSDPFGVGVYLVSQVAAEEVKVVMGGDGGDENFAGYDRFAGQRLAEMYSHLPLWLRKTVMKRAMDLVPDSFGYKSTAQKLRWLNDMSLYGSGERYAQSMSFLRFTPEAKQQLFTASARAALSDNDSVQKILDHFDAENADELVDKMLYTDLMTRIPDHLLLIVDRMAMAHSLESRPPLLDYKFVEYAAAIPGHLKLKGRNLKYILKRVADRYLPKELISREKQGFGFPLARWMRTDLKDFLRRLFAQSRFVEMGLFERAYVDQLLEEHLSGKSDHNFRIWILLNLEIWYRLYFEGETVDSMRDFIDALMRPPEKTS